MMNNKNENKTFQGKPATIIGNTMADLVLETLGKVYIKTGRKAQLLNDFIRQLDESTSSTSKIKNRIIIVSSQSEMESMEYPGEGYFIYNELTSILYMSLKGKYIALVNASEIEEGEYVKKTGDVMTGPLEIITDKPNLIISSNKLIKNLNSNYLNGYSDIDFAKKAKNESITGNWTFEGKGVANNNWTFNQNTRFNKDIIANKSISSPEFASGFAGYGWRLDADTNMLTIDYLVVRKAMRVYEMVINKISATNGSLWISNSSKIDKVYRALSDRTLTPDGDYYLELVDNTFNLWRKATPSDTQIELTDTQIELTEFDNIKNAVMGDVNLYKKYFISTSNSVLNCYIIDTDPEEYPLFKAGDILRCQKYLNGNIKYYDALVIHDLKNRKYLIQCAESVFDKYSEIEYDEEGKITSNTEKYNTILYKKTNPDYSPTTEKIAEIKTLTEPTVGDDLIQIGNIYNTTRQGAIYLTSTDDQGPYIDVLDGVNRPDYSVLIPTKTHLFYQENNISYYIIPKGIFPMERYPKIKVLYVKFDNTAYSETEAEGFPPIPAMYFLTTTPLPDDVDLCLTYNTYKKPTKVRLGKLDGIYNQIFKDKQPHGYGLYGENVFLTGEFVLSNGKSVIDINNEITIAVGEVTESIESINENINTLNEDVVKHNDLESAGMYINEDNIVLWGDAIKIVTEKTELENPENYTALFTDGKLKAQVFEAVSDSTTNKSVILTIGNKDYELIGYTQQGTSGTPGTQDSVNSYENGVLTIGSDNELWFNNSKGYLVYSTNGFMSVTDLDSTDSNFINTYLDQVTEIRYNNVVYNIRNNKLKFKKYTSLSINKLGKGEIVYYWEDGSVMNCKIFNINTSTNTLQGCIEYFFDPGYCYLEPINYILSTKYYISNNSVLGAIEGENGCVKIINYFETPSTQVTVSDITTYLWKIWNETSGTYSKDYGCFSGTLKNDDIAIIAKNCDGMKNIYYYISEIEFDSSEFTYQGKLHDVKKYLYKSPSCTSIISTILTKKKNGEDITREDYNNWYSYVLSTNDLKKLNYSQNSGAYTFFFVTGYTINMKDMENISSASIAITPYSEGIYEHSDLHQVLIYNKIE